MPYIKQEQRDIIDSTIKQLAEEIKSLSLKPPRSREGIMNYTITKLIQLVYGSDLRYADYNDITGFLENCKLEVYRKQTAIYEDIKEKENGSV